MSIRKRLIKTGIYKACSLAITFVIALILTGKVGISFAIGGLELLISTVFYYFYEMMWEEK